MMQASADAYDQLVEWDKPEADSLSRVQARRRLERCQVYVELGKPEVAEPLLVDVVVAIEKLEGKESRPLATALATQATAVEKLGRVAEAERLWQESLRLSELVYGSRSVQQAQALHAVGRLLTRQDKLDLAKFSLEEAADIYAETVPPDGPEVVRLLLDLSACRSAAGEEHGAKRDLDHALELARAWNVPIGAPRLKGLLAEALKRKLDRLTLTGDASPEERRALKRELVEVLTDLQRRGALSKEEATWMENLTGTAKAGKEAS
jgi:tetratricopeptide (TPR) repeat protein